MVFVTNRDWMAEVGLAAILDASLPAQPPETVAGADGVTPHRSPVAGYQDAKAGVALMKSIAEYYQGVKPAE